MIALSDKKRITVVTFFSVLLLLAGHYYISTIPAYISRVINMVNCSALLGLCLFGSLFLLADSRNIRPQRIFALQMLLVALVAASAIIRILIQDNSMPVSSHITYPKRLIYGNIYAFVMLMYPLELLHTCKMPLNRYFKLLLPAIMVCLLYYIYILTGHRVIDIRNWHDILSNITNFGVWARLVILIYPLWLFAVILHKRHRYIVCHRKHSSNDCCTGLDKLDHYLFGYFLIMISYMIVTLSYTPQNLLMHSVYFLMFIGFSFYSILRYGAPDLPKPTDENRTRKLSPEFQPDTISSTCEEVDTAVDKYRFIDRISEYQVMLEQWMQTEKPYLNKDFKLLDVMQALPLNRSYISRMFNEAYGETFFSFVMRHRIEESIRMLETRPDLTIAHISDICGFSSPSVFGRAFLKNVGVTPKEYRKRQNRINETM